MNPGASSWFDAKLNSRVLPSAAPRETGIKACQAAYTVFLGGTSIPPARRGKLAIRKRKSCGKLRARTPSWRLGMNPSLTPKDSLRAGRGASDALTPNRHVGNRPGMFSPSSASSWQTLAVVVGLLAACNRAKSQTFIRNWTVAGPSIIGSASATAAIEGFYANTSGPDDSTSQSFNATIKVGDVVYDADVPPAPEGYEYQYRAGSSIPPTDVSIEVTVTATWSGTFTITVPSDDTHAAALASATLSGFSITSFGQDFGGSFGRTYDRSTQLGPGGSIDLAGQVNGFIYAPRQYNGRVGVAATLSLTTSGDPAQGYLTYELVKLPDPPVTPPVTVPEPEQWAMAALLPLGAWAFARRVHAARKGAGAPR